jgi:uncharacterized Tic20 family protein
MPENVQKPSPNSAAQPTAALHRPPTPPPSPESQARMWNMLCHLSALAGFIGIPFGNILGPLIVWQIKKNEFPSVDVHGKAALNFQITVTDCRARHGAALFVGVLSASAGCCFRW